MPNKDSNPAMEDTVDYKPGHLSRIQEYFNHYSMFSRPEVLEKLRKFGRVSIILAAIPVRSLDEKLSFS